MLYGHHYYTHPKALDFFYATQGQVLVALAALDDDYRELYYLDGPRAAGLASATQSAPTQRAASPLTRPMS